MNETGNQQGSGAETVPIRCGIADGFVYFVRSGEFIKIGYSRSPLARMRGLQRPGVPKVRLLLCFPGSPNDEKYYHRAFANLRQPGAGELFRADPALTDFIKETREKHVWHSPMTAPRGPAVRTASGQPVTYFVADPATHWRDGPLPSIPRRFHFGLPKPVWA